GRDIDHVPAVIGDGGQHGVIGLDVAADGLHRGTLHRDVDLFGADDAVAGPQVVLAHLQKVIVGGLVPVLEQHHLVLVVLGVLAGSQFQHRAEGGVLGHPADRPGGRLVIDRDAVFGGVAGVGVGGGAAAGDEHQPHVHHDADQYERGHPDQKAGGPLLCGGLTVDLSGHDGTSPLTYDCKTQCTL